MEKRRDKHFTRRQVLQLAGYSAAAVPLLMLLTARPAWSQGKTSQQAANYQDQPKNGQQCSGCENFIAPDRCNLVEGKISSEGWCRLYTPKQG